MKSDKISSKIWFAVTGWHDESCQRLFFFLISKCIFSIQTREEELHQLTLATPNTITDTANAARDYRHVVQTSTQLQHQILHLQNKKIVYLIPCENCGDTENALHI